MVAFLGSQEDHLPNSFDLHTATFTDIDASDLWPTVTMYAAYFRARMILGVLPPLLQLQNTLMRIARDRETPHVALASAQRDSALTMLETLPIDGIVTVAAHFPTVAAWRAESAWRGYIQVVCAPTEAMTYSGAHFEIHIRPGVVALYSCAARTEGGVFHLIPGFSLAENGAALLDPQGASYALAHAFRDERMSCSCGISSTYRVL